MKISTILDLIDGGTIALPEFQRGYVWNRDQVRGLMLSLYRRYPIGGLLVWSTQAGAAKARGEGTGATGAVKLLLDGQQRITTLYGLVRGTPPRFFEGNAQAFTGLYFDVENEVFEFHAPTKMQGNPMWVSVTDLMQKDPMVVGAGISSTLGFNDKTWTYMGRLNRIHQIKEIDLHVEEITGPEMTIEVVVDIFNKVNSGGTKLSQGDLALAKVCADWPEARTEMRKALATWQQAGFRFRLDWLMRNINTVVTGKAKFAALEDVELQKIQDGLKRATKACNFLLNLIASRLGLDHHDVLEARNAFPVMSRYVAEHGGVITDTREQDKLLFWYVHSMLWGRFSGTTETIIDQDLTAVREGGLDRLIDQLGKWRGDLTVRPSDFSGYSTGARFYPMLYLLTRVFGARDLKSGLSLSAHMLGHNSALHVHHIFPKSLLYQAGYSRAEVNAVANFCFLTQETNLWISNRHPKEYLAEVDPTRLQSQWIPLDPALWEIDRYRDFLEARRELLAQAANQFLNQLLHGTVAPAATAVTDAAPAPITIVSPMDEEVAALASWIAGMGLSAPEIPFQVTSPDTGEVVATADLAWPDGLQAGLTDPIALVLVEPEAVRSALERLGYKLFASVEALKSYLESQLESAAD